MESKEAWLMDAKSRNLFGATTQDDKMLSKNPFRNRVAAQATGASTSSSASASTSTGLQDIFADPTATANNPTTGPSEGVLATQDREQGGTGSSQATPALPSSATNGPALPPRPVGALNSSSRTPASGTPSTTGTESGLYLPPPGPPPTSRTPSDRTPALDDSMGALSLDAPPAPPAYSPAPNVWVGEATMEFGPRRAFQDAPPPLIQPMPGMLSGPPAVLYQPAPTGPRRFGNNPYPEVPLGGPLPPRRIPHRTPSPPPPPRQPIGTPENPRSPFPARVPNGQYPGYNPPRYQPPPPPPPARHYAIPGVQRDPYPQQSHFPPAPSEHVEDDGKPTKIAVVGHPLLHEGKVLIYTPGYECRTCANTGYKSRGLRSRVDLKDPCKRCWRKFGRTYEGALTFATWKPAAESFQRPIWVEANGGSLPIRRRSNSTGHLPSSTTGTGNQPTISAFARDFYTSGPTPDTAPVSPYPASSSTSYMMGPNTQLNITQGQTRMAQTPVALPVGNIAGLPIPAFPFGRSLYSPTPPAHNMAVVRPGDARIGGRVCWKCGGDGEVARFIFDTETCRVCRGVGRIFA